MRTNESQTVPASKPVVTIKPEIKLPGIIFKCDFERKIRNDPLGALETIVRTPEELSTAIDSLTAEPIYYADKIEALILAMNEREYPLDEIKKVIHWYGMCKRGEGDQQRKDFELMRAFRFLLGTKVNGVSLAGTWVAYLICFWDNSIINDMVRKNPWLYWCHKRYQDGIAETLEKFAKRDHSRPYGDHDWQAVERYIRRVVEAGDWSHSQRVHTIYRLHKEDKLMIDERSGEGKDPFTPNRIKTFLEDAVGFLARQKREDGTRSAQVFGTALEARGDFNGKIFVVANGLKEILITKDHPASFKFSVSIFAEDRCDSAELSDLLSRVSLELEIDGGYFPAVDGNNQRMAFLKKNTGAIGEYEFHFMPFEGRGRLTLTLLYRDKDSAVESFTITSRHFFEAKAANTEVGPQ